MNFHDLANAPESIQEITGNCEPRLVTAVNVQPSFLPALSRTPPLFTEWLDQCFHPDWFPESNLVLINDGNPRPISDIEINYPDF